MNRGLAVAVGGVAGAAVRYGVIEASGPVDFPWPVLAVNVLGCLLLGLLTCRSELTRAGLGAGFCGGLTTFSTFTVELAARLDRGATGTAVAYLAASIGAGLLAAYTGTRWAR